MVNGILANYKTQQRNGQLLKIATAGSLLDDGKSIDRRLLCMIQSRLGHDKWKAKKDPLQQKKAYDYLDFLAKMVC